MVKLQLTPGPLGTEQALEGGGRHRANSVSLNACGSAWKCIGTTCQGLSADLGDDIAFLEGLAQVVLLVLRCEWGHLSGGMVKQLCNNAAVDARCQLQKKGWAVRC